MRRGDGPCGGLGILRGGGRRGGRAQHRQDEPRTAGRDQPREVQAVRGPPQHPHLVPVDLDPRDLAHRRHEQRAVSTARSGLAQGHARAEIEQQRTVRLVLLQRHLRLQSERAQVRGVRPLEQEREGDGTGRALAPGERPRPVQAQRLQGRLPAAGSLGLGRHAPDRADGRLVVGEEDPRLVRGELEPVAVGGQLLRGAGRRVVEAQSGGDPARGEGERERSGAGVDQEEQLAVGEAPTDHAHLPAVPDEPQRRRQRGAERLCEGARASAVGPRTRRPVGAVRASRAVRVVGEIRTVGADRRISRGPHPRHRERPVVREALVVDVLLRHRDRDPCGIRRRVHGEHRPARGPHPVQPVRGGLRQPCDPRQHHDRTGGGVEGGEDVVVDEVEVVAGAADHCGGRLADVSPAGAPQVVSLAAGGADVAVGEVEGDVRPWQAEAQGGAEPGELGGELGHRRPPGVAVIQRAGGVERPAQPVDVGCAVGPAVADEVGDPEQQVLMRLGEEVQRRGAEGRGVHPGPHLAGDHLAPVVMGG